MRDPTRLLIEPTRLVFLAGIIGGVLAPASALWGAGMILATVAMALILWKNERLTGLTDAFVREHDINPCTRVFLFVACVFMLLVYMDVMLRLLDGFLKSKKEGSV